MDAYWTLETLAESTGGRWLRVPRQDEPRKRLALSTDSRTVEPGEVFLALAGDRFDGHLFLEQAIQRGARVLIVHDEAAGQTAAAVDQIGVLLVPDTQTTLADLARTHRRTLRRTTVIGITGSNGKTTTKRLLHAALATTLRGSASRRSFNNHVGVPLTLLAAHPEDDYLIVEVGTNAPGEIAALADLVQPHIGIVTGIGQSHLQGLGSLKGVLEEKLDLLRALPTGATAIVNADAPLLRDAVASDPALTKLRLRTYGIASATADLRAEQLSLTPAGTSLTIAGASARLNLLGAHNALNALAALAAAEALGVERTAALRGMADVEPRDMRLQVQQSGELLILNDAYNANPDSMRAALNTFTAITSDDRRRVLILGDMLELGPAAEEAHATVARQIAALERGGATIHLIVLIGELMQIAAAVLAQEQSSAAILPFAEGLTDAELPQIRALIARDDQILIKGSRRLALERIVAALETNALAQMS